MTEFLHERRDFAQLIAIVAERRGIDPVLVEKDYWIMHCLWGLQAQEFRFELKGGTSLSKGFGVIHRFSEDDKMRSAGIRLLYPGSNPTLAGIKTGILLELGFDDTEPNRPVTISSWAYDVATERKVAVTDNRALDVPCYVPTYTFVEKLQTISTKYRRLAESDTFPSNFLRHYYDVYCLLELPEVLAFIDTPAYEARKAQRFRTGDERVIARNPAFLLENPAELARFEAEYQKTAALYYDGQPGFDAVLARIRQHVSVM